MAALTKRIFRIQYVSDLHLEFYDKATFPLLVKPAARNLALAGDIGQPGSKPFHSFLEYTHRNWDNVFYVAGNHEYYAKRPYTKWGEAYKPNHMFETQEAIKAAVAPYKNIHFLDHDNPSHYLAQDNVAIIGSTMWSFVPPGIESFEAALKMNDYNYIPFPDASGSGIRRLTPADVRELHAKHKSMLEAQIDYWGSQKAHVCMITHHMPSFSLVSPRYADHPLTCCFAANCESLMKPWVRAWIYGHTHNACVGPIKKTQTAINARGYPNEHVPGFSTEAWLEFMAGERAETEALSPELAASAAGIKPPQMKLSTEEEECEFM